MNRRLHSGFRFEGFSVGGPDDQVVCFLDRMMYQVRYMLFFEKRGAGYCRKAESGLY